MTINVGNLVVKLSARTQELTKGLARSQAALNSTAESMRRVSRVATMMSGAMAAAGAATAFMAGRFEKQMVRAAGIAAGSAQNFDKSFETMKRSALDLAGRTEFTAKQVGEGMEFMAMAGNDASTTIAAMPAVLQLASAASLDLGRSADIVTNVMAGFGKGTAELANANNVLVGTFTSSNVSLSELGEAFKTAGPVAKTLKVTFEDTAAAIGLLGNAGIKGSEAGTGLKRAMTALVNITPRSAKAIKQLGLDTSALTDPKRGFGSVIAQLEGTRDAFEKTGRTAEFTALLFQVFGERAGPKMAALVEQGSASFDKLKKKIDEAKATNIAEFLETKQVQSFQGQLNILVSALEKLAITVGDRVIPILKPMVQDLTRVIDSLSSMTTETWDNVVQWGKWIVVGGAAVGAAASLSAALLSTLAAVGMASAAAGALGVSLGALAFGPLAAVAVGFAAFAATLAVVEEVTGENIDVIGTLTGAVSFASQGTTEFNATMRDLGMTLVATLADLTGLTLIFPKLKSFLGELTGQVTDLDSELQHLDDTENQLIESTKKLKNLDKLFAKGTDLGARRTGRVLGTTEDGVPVRAFQKSFATAEEIAQIKELNDEIEGAFEARADALEKLAARKKALDDKEKAERKKAEDEKAAADKEALRRRKEALAAARRSAAASTKSAKEVREEARAVKQIAELRKDALRDLEKDQTRARFGVGEGVDKALDFVNDFRDRMTELTEAADKAGGALSDPNFLGSSDLMREQLFAQAAEFARSKVHTEEFGTAVAQMAAVIDAEVPGLGQRLREFAAGLGSTQKVDLTKAPSLGFIDDLVTNMLEEEKKIRDAGLSDQGKITERLQRATENEIAARLRALRGTADFADALLFVEGVVDDLGLSFENVANRMKRIDPTTTASDLAIEGLTTVFAGGRTDDDARASAGVVAGQTLRAAQSLDFSAITGAVGAAIGAAAGAPGVGAEIGSMLGGLLESLPSFEKAVTPVTTAFQMLLTILDPIIGALQPLFDVVAVLLVMLGKALQPVVQVIVALLGPIIDALVPGLQLSATLLRALGVPLQLFANLVDMIAAPLLSMFAALSPINIAFSFLAPILEVLAVGIAHLNNLIIGGVIWAFDELIKPITWIAGLFAWLGLAVEGMGLAVEKFLLDITGRGLGDRAREIEARQSEIAAEMARPLEELGAPVAADMRAALDGMIIDIDELTSDFRDVVDVNPPDVQAPIDAIDDAVDKLTEKLTNVPEGFKAALARFEAADPETPGMRTVGTGPREVELRDGAAPIIMEVVNITTPDDRALLDAIRRQADGASRRAGAARSTFGRYSRANR